jgi:hypothetical protein
VHLCRPFCLQLPKDACSPPQERPNLNDTYTGGCLFVDHATGYVHVEHQAFLTSHETLKAKNKFELMCRDFGVMPQTYLSDNHKAFTAAEFTDQLKSTSASAQVCRCRSAPSQWQSPKETFAPSSPSHRTMMLHSAIHWPQVADSTLWPMAVSHAVYSAQSFP